MAKEPIEIELQGGAYKPHQQVRFRVREWARQCDPHQIKVTNGKVNAFTISSQLNKAETADSFHMEITKAMTSQIYAQILFDHDVGAQTLAQVKDRLNQPRHMVDSYLEFWKEQSTAEMELSILLMVG